MGARRGAAIACYLLLVWWIADLFEDPDDPIVSIDWLSACVAFVASWALGGAFLQALKPAVNSVYAAMLLWMLCVVPPLLGTGILLSGWRGAALRLLLLTVPLGAALGLVGWRRHDRSPPAASNPPAA